MPRPRLKREPCDCADCREGGPPPPPSGAAAAAARQAPPPKSLVLCLNGVLQPGQDSRVADLPHLHAAVRAGWAGLLACRAGGPALPLQLLGLPAAGVAPAQSLPDRFKQLRAALLTDSADVAQAGKLAGCYAVHQLDDWPAPASLAARICKLLQVRPWAAGGAAGPQPAAAAALPALATILQAATAGQGAGTVAAAGAAEEEEEEDVIDMLLLSMEAASNSSGSSASNAHINGAVRPAAASSGEPADAASNDSNSSTQASAALEWADAVLSHLNQAPGFRDTVLLSLVVGPGQQPLCQQPLLAQEQPLLACDSAPERHQPCAAVQPAAAAAAADCPPVRRPLQSYQFAGQERIAVDAARPALVVHRLAGVIRVDAAAALDLAEVRAHGAAGCILAERLLPEVAYKLGRAPKYGA
ncbi:hypothetical protein ABPG75_001238 [Micractinium tetrahymenae]